MNKFEQLKEELSRLQPFSPARFGASMIVAPHPDDETLGCGGTVALLARSGIPVHFVFVSDGSMSHPNSKKFPAFRLRKLRESEARNAVRKLGGEVSNIEFLRLKDSMVPNREDLDFMKTVSKIAKHVDLIRPHSVFIPWQRDPHQDHRATWNIMQEALHRTTYRPRVLEYPVWFWERGDPADFEALDAMSKLVVNVEEMLSIKNEALAEHVSQVTHLIDDDPDGFILSPEVIAHFNTPLEVFFESRN
jgi:LmbE family N-acetylglucosaminyl deacetylase